MSEINVTPMVDVMLVLLIIFMVSAPLLTVGVPIDLPQSQATSLDQDKEPLAISVNDKGQVFLQNTEIKLDELVPKLKAIAEARGGTDERIYVRGDKKRGLRDDDAGDGTAVGGRLPPGGLGDGSRTGLESTCEMRTASAISAGLHAAVLLWALVSFSGKTFEVTPAESLPVDIITDKEFSEMTKGDKNAPKAETPKPLVEKIDEPKPAERDRAQDHREEGNQAPTRGKDRRSREAAAQARSDRREAQEGGRAESRKPRPSRSRCRRRSRRRSSSRNSTPTRSPRCSTSATRSARPRPARSSIRRRRSAPPPAAPPSFRRARSMRCARG